MHRNQCLSSGCEFIFLKAVRELSFLEKETFGRNFPGPKKVFLFYKQGERPYRLSSLVKFSLQNYQRNIILKKFRLLNIYHL